MGSFSDKRLITVNPSAKGYPKDGDGKIIDQKPRACRQYATNVVRNKASFLLESSQKTGMIETDKARAVPEVKPD